MNRRLFLHVVGILPFAPGDARTVRETRAVVYTVREGFFDPHRGVVVFVPVQRVAYFADSTDGCTAEIDGDTHDRLKPGQLLRLPWGRWASTPPCRPSP